MAGRAVDGERHPLPRSVGRQPSSAALRRRGAAGLGEPRDRRTRRRTDPDALRQRRVRGGRRGVHIPVGIGDHPPQPPLGAPRRCTGCARSPGSCGVLPGPQRRSRIRRRHRSRLGRCPLHPSHRRARSTRSGAVGSNGCGRLRRAGGDDAARDRRRRGRGAVSIHPAGPVDQCAAAQRRPAGGDRAGTGGRSLRVVLRTQHGAVRRHRRLAVPARDVPPRAARLDARHDRALVDVVERVRGPDVADHPSAHAAARLGRADHARGAGRGHRARHRPDHPPTRG